MNWSVIRATQIDAQDMKQNNKSKTHIYIDRI